MFGYLDGGRVFQGLVRFSDGELLNPVKAIGPFKVVVGAPDPSHKPFYPGPHLRKFYHHRFGAQELTTTHLAQHRVARPLPPGARFAFRVDFENLRDEELNLLLYCLILEEEATVILSREALGGQAAEPQTLRGPLRHKFGSCKPQGGGSVRIGITRLELRANPAERYHSGSAAQLVLEGENMQTELLARTTVFRQRTDPTMTHLRAMWIYVAGDPRPADLEYPDYTWFQAEKQHHGHTPLKPTL
jgi:hypothetical protein